jgi:hypothetical protein
LKTPLAITPSGKLSFLVVSMVVNITISPPKVASALARGKL